jgi:hypothetical protein
MGIARFVRTGPRNNAEAAADPASGVRPAKAFARDDPIRA